MNSTIAKKVVHILLIGSLVFVLTGYTHDGSNNKMISPFRASLQSGIGKQLDAYQPGSSLDENNQKIKQDISGCFEKFSTVKTFDLSGDDKTVRPV